MNSIQYDSIKQSLSEPKRGSANIPDIISTQVSTLKSVFLGTPIHCQQHAECGCATSKIPQHYSAM